jgi:hypothetical protein
MRERVRDRQTHLDGSGSNLEMPAGDHRRGLKRSGRHVHTPASHDLPNCRIDRPVLAASDICNSGEVWHGFVEAWDATFQPSLPGSGNGRGRRPVLVGLDAKSRDQASAALWALGSRLRVPWACRDGALNSTPREGSHGQPMRLSCRANGTRRRRRGVFWRASPYGISKFVPCASLFLLRSARDPPACLAAPLKKTEGCRRSIIHDPSLQKELCVKHPHRRCAPRRASLLHA